MNNTAQHSITTQAGVRSAFWDTFSASIARHYRRGKRQNDYPAEVRTAFVEFVDSLHRDGTISDALAARVTL